MELVRDAKALKAIANAQGVNIWDLEFYYYSNDIESVVNAALEEFAGEFDTEAIVDRAFGWYVPRSLYVSIVSPDAFWQIVEECELTHVDRSRTR
jgi:hypothetical protein